MNLAASPNLYPFGPNGKRDAYGRLIMKNFDRCVIILGTPQNEGSSRSGCEKAFTYRYPFYVSL